jgi:hypothetical protein
MQSIKDTYSTKYVPVNQQIIMKFFFLKLCEQRFIFWITESVVMREWYSMVIKYVEGTQFIAHRATIPPRSDT